METKFYIGCKLIAISKCQMNGTNEKTLTKGKIYQIISVDEAMFEIIDDTNQNHLFPLSEYQKWFLKFEDIH